MRVWEKQAQQAPSAAATFAVNKEPCPPQFSAQGAGAGGGGDGAGGMGEEWGGGSVTVLDTNYNICRKTVKDDEPKQYPTRDIGFVS